MRRHATVLSLAALTLTAVACSGEDAAESFLENAIEAEGGGDVDIEFDGDGSFSIETEDGSMILDDEGNLVITGEDGEVITGNVDAEDGSFEIEGDDGSFSVDADDDGTMTFETDEGTMTIEQSSGIPDEWPADVPRPEGLAIETSQVSNAPEEGFVLISTGGATADGEAWVDQYGAMVEAAGFTETFRIDTPDGAQVGWEREGQILSVLAASSDGGAQWDVFLSLNITNG